MSAEPKITDRRILDIKGVAKAAWRKKHGAAGRDKIWAERLALKHQLEDSGVPRAVAETKSWITIFGKYPFVDELDPRFHTPQIIILQEIMAGTLTEIPDIAELPRITEAKLVPVTESHGDLQPQPEIRHVVTGGTAEVDADDTVLHRDIIWVYQHLRDAKCTEADAPNHGAWALLQWAKDNNIKEFFKSMLPKAVRPRKAVEEQRADLLESHPDVQKLMDWIDRTATMRGWTSIRKRLEEPSPTFA